MQLRKTAIALTATLAVAASAGSPAMAAHWGGGHWHGGGWGGAAAGFAAGALIGGAAAAASAPYYGAPYYYDDAYAYQPGVVYEDSYAAAPAYGAGRDDAYCASRYRSYDPASGTYLGYDGIRHPCP